MTTDFTNSTGGILILPFCITKYNINCNWSRIKRAINPGLTHHFNDKCLSLVFNSKVFLILPFGIQTFLFNHSIDYILTFSDSFKFFPLFLNCIRYFPLRSDIIASIFMNHLIYHVNDWLVLFSFLSCVLLLMQIQHFPHISITSRKSSGMDSK